MAEGYDYVVVGAGSAGAVLAARLSEDPAVRVLLLEAGGPDDADEIAMPAAFASLFKTRWCWGYATTDQQHLAGRRAYWPRMKALGGCSAMNAMIYMRGHRLDYDGWRDTYGATGWGYDEVLPYFVRSERNSRHGGPFHGTDGPLHVEDRRYTHELTRAWVDAAVASGLPANDDFNGAALEGAGLYQVTCHRGRRWSVADGWLRPAAARPNLVVRTHALASSVVLEGGRARGVRYLRRGRQEVAYADVEVLLAGGAVNSPQLLMLSGIGPATHLREVGVEVGVDLPGVGANLHDHPATPLIWETRRTTDLAESATLANVARWRLTGTGPVSSNIGEGGGFLRSRDDLAAPDLQVHIAPSGFYDNGLHEPDRRRFTAAATLVSVASRGSLRLRSADPTWHPAIDPAYFDDRRDLDAMLAGLRRIDEVASYAPLSGLLTRRSMPGPDAISDADLIAHLRQRTQTLYHPVGTCAMGSGEHSVVDPELRVRGVDGLRVVDASVMPEVPRGNTNAPTIMIAEKAADLIRGRRAPEAVRTTPRPVGVLA